MPYISMGDPTYEHTIQWAEAISDSTDILELGIPFSDPVADGPVIQKSYKRALDNNEFSLKKILSVTGTIHEKLNKPIVYLTYLNPIMQFGLKNFFEMAKLSGVMGIVVPDIPFDSKDYGLIYKQARENGISIINLVTPATDFERMERMRKFSSGFIYYVTSFGVTGERSLQDPSLVSRIEKVKDIFKIPVLAGFGISEPSQASYISKHSDGVIIGSRIQKIIEEESKDPQACMYHLSKYTSEIKSSIGN